jgi:peptidoglycan-associated lipoprotein
MIRSLISLRAALVWALVVVLGLGACGGNKRKPAVLTDPGRTPAGPASPAPWPSPAEPAEAGPDVQPMAEDAARAVDYSADTESGGGPLADIHFALEQATLSDEARATLEKHALWMQNHREAKVTIEGHCDERGTVDYNLALGDSRARAALEYLLNLGVAKERLNAISLGKERPLDASSNEAAWAKNRRAHFVIVR